MSAIRHRTIQTNGIQMHIAEAGDGPMVLLCHGFPEIWYSWRHQLPALAQAGYRVVAPDMRGYGRTDAPEAIDQYTVFHLVGDMVGLLDALGEQRAAIVGHDWGSIVAWSAALLRPERFRGVVGMSVPFIPRAPIRPTQLMKAAAGDRFMYILYFQEPGKAEAELDPRAGETMRKILYTASGSVPRDQAWRQDLPKNALLLDGMVEPRELPLWLTQEDLDLYIAEFERTGFRGGINWYRNLDRNWELMAPWQGVGISVPALFIGGLRDFVVTGPGGEGPGPMVQALDQHCSVLRGIELITDSGHWTQQESPQETNKALIGFLGGL
jgi:pimeloyl-ACP methyl ester carboxylesterase